MADAGDASRCFASQCFANRAEIKECRGCYQAVSGAFPAVLENHLSSYFVVLPGSFSSRRPNSVETIRVHFPNGIDEFKRTVREDIGQEWDPGVAVGNG